MTKAFLITGSNLGNRLQLLEKVSGAIHNTIGTVLRKSAIYESEPWGFDHPTKFLNQVLEIEISMDPMTLLKHLQEVERIFGRIRKGERYSARTMDIDILFYGSIIFQSEYLTIPHPGLAKRKFVLVPLYELIPSFEHPVLKKTVEQLIALCEDDSDVSLFEKSHENR